MAHKNDKNKKSNNRFAAILCLGFLILWLILGANPMKLLISWDKVMGKIVSVNSTKHENDEWKTYYMYSPTIEYTCWSSTVTQKTKSSSSTKYIEGKNIVVLCDPNDPTNFMIIDDVIRGLIVPIIPLMAAIACLIVMLPKSKKNSLPIGMSISIPTIIILLGAFIVFWSFWLYSIYSLIIWGVSVWALLWAPIGCIVAWVLRNSLIYKLEEHLRIAIAKKKVKRWRMIPVQMTIIWFKFSGEVMETDCYYQIICSDWQKELYSEEMLWKVSWFQTKSFEYLESLKIIYNPKNPQETLDKLNDSEYLASKTDRMIINITKIIWKLNLSNSSEDVDNVEVTNSMEKYVDWLHKQTVARLNRQIKQWDQYKQPYLIFNWIRIYVWDSINVYIDPHNKKSYLVDIYHFYE